MDYINPRPFIYASDDTVPTFNNTNASTMQSYHYIPVTLTSIRNPNDRRRLIINAGERVNIGRASRSDTKDLRASTDNALFDCPVISRQHAELKVHPFKPVEEQVTVTDRDSMHGTSVNGRRLAPYVPFSLTSGDVIKFGEKVVRGPNTHDGVIVTFDRSAATATPDSQPSRAISSGRGFHVPSDSENESDEASDNESVMSELEDMTSSVNTTPEKTKAAIGTQEQPIDIEETDAVKNPTYIELEDDDDYVPRNKTPEPKEIVQDTYAESQDAESVHDGSDQDEEQSDNGEAADDLDNLENLSDSDASDLSNYYDESGQVSESEGPELISAKKQASPELGTPEGASKVQSQPFWRPYPKPAPVYAPYPQYPMGATRADNFATSRPPYDPIRGSNPPSATTNYDLLGPRYPVPQVPAKAPSTYTYGYPGTFGGPLPTKAATDDHDSSRWDIPPRSTTFQQPTAAWPEFAPPPHFPPHLVTPAFVPMPSSTYNSYKTPATATKTPAYPTYEDLLKSSATRAVTAAVAQSWKSSTEALIEPERERATPTPLLKSRISIPDIMDTSSITLSVVDEAQPTVEEVETSDDKAIDDDALGTKRKADAISTDDAPEPSASEWVELYQAIHNDDATESAPVQQSATKRIKSVRSMGVDAAKYATAALAGGVGMVVFLASPLAQQLLES